MKTFHYTLLAIFGIALFSSCSGNLQIEKRHYRNGWYISNGRTHEKTTAASTPVSNETTAAIKETSAAEKESIQPVTVESPLVTEVKTVKKTEPAARPVKKAIPSVAVKPETHAAVAPAAVKNMPDPVTEREDGGEVHGFALASLSLGLVSLFAMIGFFVLLLAFFSPMTWIAAGVVVIASILSIVFGKTVLRSANPSVDDQRMAIAGRILGTTSLIVMTAGFLLLVALVLIALSGGGI